MGKKRGGPPFIGNRVEQREKTSIGLPPPPIHRTSFSPFKLSSERTVRQTPTQFALPLRRTTSVTKLWLPFDETIPPGGTQVGRGPLAGPISQPFPPPSIAVSDRRRKCSPGQSCGCGAECGEKEPRTKASLEMPQLSFHFHPTYNPPPPFPLHFVR